MRYRLRTLVKLFRAGSRIGPLSVAGRFGGRVRCDHAIPTPHAADSLGVGTDAVGDMVVVVELLGTAGAGGSTGGR